MKCLEKISIQFITFEECVESTAHIMEGKKSKIFFIHLSANTLAHYWVRGLICPVKFMDNRETDIQNIYDSYVLSELNLNFLQ